MRPPRPDIAIPEFAPQAEWLDGRERRASALSARGPVLVHFWELAQVNSLRTLPYLSAWHERYGEAGLTVLGVHSPRHELTAGLDDVRAAAEALEIRYPVASDSDHAVWHDYGCEGWPSLFLWRQGGVLDWFHFGEGEYRSTEEAIQALLEEGANRPPPLEPLRATDAPDAHVVAHSAELFPGGSFEEPWSASEAEAELEVSYEAGGAYATLAGEGELMVQLDDEPERSARQLTPLLYELAEHERHGKHTVVLRPAPGRRVHSVSFVAGVP